MTLLLCDFCGGEMHKGDRAATLSIRTQGSGGPTFMAVFGFNEADANARSMEMCSGCLNHLLPVSERIRAEARKTKKAKAGKAKGVIHGELNELVGLKDVSIGPISFYFDPKDPNRLP